MSPQTSTEKQTVLIMSCWHTLNLLTSSGGNTLFSDLIKKNHSLIFFFKKFQKQQHDLLGNGIENGRDNGSFETTNQWGEQKQNSSVKNSLM